MSDVRSREGEGEIAQTNTDTEENPDHGPEITPEKKFSQQTRQYDLTERDVIAVSRMVLDSRLSALERAIGNSKFSSKSGLARTYSEVNFGGSLI
jgi:hypothetical protein